jgi:tetratricopeptide (TPR) repeat protein
LTDDEIPIEECEELFNAALMIEQIQNPTNEEILDAALSFYDSAQCFDNKGERSKSAKCYTLAGEFYLAIEENEKAAECYGKAILRNLMINDLESAKVILEKGEEYGDIFDTFHFRMAKDAFGRQMDESGDLEDELKELSEHESLFDKESLDYELELPDTELDSGFDLNLEEIDLDDLSKQSIFDIGEDLNEATTFVSSFKGFNISEDIMSSSATGEKYNEILAYNLLKTSRKRKETKIRSAGVGKGLSGFIKDLESEIKIFRKDTLRDKNLQLSDLEIKSLSELDLDFSDKAIEEITLPDKDEQREPGSLLPINESFTLENEFISISEVSADDDDLEDIEIQDSIPYSWQIKDIDTGGFELLSKDIDKETGSLIFTWRRNKLLRGEKARIKYILRRRLQRSIVMVSRKRIYVIESFHSITEGENPEINIEFKNPYEDEIDHLLIEDLLPDEVKVVAKSTSKEKDSSLQIYSTKEGLIYRWIFESVQSQESIQIKYSITDRPYTRWYEQIYNLKGIPALKVEKIAEPLIEYEDNQYVLFLELHPDETLNVGEIEVKDEIPFDTEVISSYPVWFRPSIEINEVNQKFLTWSKIELEGKTRRVSVRLRINSHYNPQEPIVIFKDHKIDLKQKVRKDEKAEGVLDLRKRMGLALVSKD